MDNRSTTIVNELKMNTNSFIKNNRRILDGFCRRNHIIRLSIFGSMLKGEQTLQSDIDLLVQFHPGHIPGLLSLAGMEIGLSNLLGKKVDFRTAQDLSKIFTLRRTKKTAVRRHNPF